MFAMGEAYGIAVVRSSRLAAWTMQLLSNPFSGYLFISVRGLEDTTTLLCVVVDKAGVLNRALKRFKEMKAWKIISRSSPGINNVSTLCPLLSLL